MWNPNTSEPCRLVHSHFAFLHLIVFRKTLQSFPCRGRGAGTVNAVLVYFWRVSCHSPHPPSPTLACRGGKKNLLKTCFNQGTSTCVMRDSRSAGASSAPCLISPEEGGGAQAVPLKSSGRGNTDTSDQHTTRLQLTHRQKKKRPLSFCEVPPWCVQSRSPSRRLGDETHLRGCSGFILEDTAKCYFIHFISTLRCDFRFILCSRSCSSGFCVLSPTR